MIKKVCTTIFVWVIIAVAVMFTCSFILEQLVYAEVPIKYNSKICKMEIITSADIKIRNAKEVIEKKVLEFCKDKYIYNIDVAIDKGIYIFVIMYNNIVE